MNNGITVESGSISSMLSSFQGEMAKLDELLNKINEETSKIKTSWEGEASDSTLQEIEKFKQVFESIKQQNVKYTGFLNGVIEKYTDEDTGESSFISSNDHVFDSTYNGR